MTKPARTKRAMRSPEECFTGPLRSLVRRAVDSTCISGPSIG